MSDLFQDQNQTNKAEKPSIQISTQTVDDFLDPSQKATELGNQLNWIFTQKKVEYLDLALNLSNHKSVQVRRKLATGLPSISTKEVLPRLKEWQNIESDRETWLLLEASIDKVERGLDGAEINSDHKVFSVSEALTYLKKLIGDRTFTIEGEFSEIRLFQRTGTDIYYLGLKDKQENRIDCMLLSHVAYRAGFPINDGLTVRATGKFKLGKQSRVYFDIQRLELTGEGELLRNLKLLEEKLNKEGLFDESRKRKIPVLPKRILLLASPNSAAIKDFLKVLDTRRSNLEIYFLPIKTQGVGAEFEILNALEKVNSITEEKGVDTVVMTRGGGSQDDLFVFNSEKIVRAIHGINRPTIVAIGHERDTTLAELVADLRCATPSQSAEKVSWSNSEVFYQSRNSFEIIKNIVFEKKYKYADATQKLFNNIAFLMREEVNRARQICQMTNQVASSLIYNLKINTGRVVQSCHFLVNEEVKRLRVGILSLENYRLSYNFEVKNIRNITNNRLYEVKRNLKNNLDTIKNRVEIVDQKIKLYDPKNVLELGYAIIRQKGEIIDSITKINKQEKLEIEMRDGRGEF